MTMLTYALAATCLVAGSLTTVVKGQMSGHFTIDPNSSATTNFKTFSAATKALAGAGVSGPVVIDVASGTYAEAWRIDPITGTSWTNTVTFRSRHRAPGERVRLRPGGTSLLLITTGVNNVHLEGFVFEAVNGFAAIDARQGFGTSDDIVIRDCVFANSITPNPQYGAIHIYLARRWKILGCQFDVRGTAIYTYSTFEMLISGNKFHSNGFPYCLNPWRTTCWIYNNLFTGSVSYEVVPAWEGWSKIAFCHNTCVIETPGHVFGNRGCRSCPWWNSISNNIFVVTGKGSALYNKPGPMECDNNLFFVESGRIGREGMKYHTSLASWSKAMSGYAKRGAHDANSIVGNPRFRGTWDYHLTPSSPAVGTANPTVGVGLPWEQVTRDFDGMLRGSAKDIGAFELTGWRFYGVGCVGNFNLTPRIDVSGDIARGSKASIDITWGSAVATAMLAVGFQRTAIPFLPPPTVGDPLDETCRLLTAPLFLVFTVTDLNGNVSIPLSIPKATPVTGLGIYMQLGILEPLAPRRLALTRGIAFQF